MNVLQKRILNILALVWFALKLRCKVKGNTSHTTSYNLKKVLLLFIKKSTIEKKKSNILLKNSKMQLCFQELYNILKKIAWR